MSRRELLGFAAAACVACCIGPVVGALGAIATLSFVATMLIGSAGLLIAAAAIALVFVLRRRRARPCSATSAPSAVELTRRPL